MLLEIKRHVIKELSIWWVYVRVVAQFFETLATSLLLPL